MASENKYVIVVRNSEAYLHLRKKQKTTSIRHGWNDLPVDLVGEIMVRLYSADRIRFSACCKSFWSLMPNYNRGEIDQFPWLVKGSFRSSMNQSSFKLFDPIQKTPYSVTSIRGISGDKMKLLCSRNGWLLLLGRKQTLSPNLEGEERKLPPLSSSLVLVSPFTKQIIALPDLDHSPFIVDQLYTRFMVASYSCDPSSPDCVYFVLWQTSDIGWIRTSTFRNGDTKWNSGLFHTSGSFASVVYHDRSFYCVFIDGRIATYNVVENKFGGFITRPKPAKRPRNCNRYAYLLVYEGKLLVVFLDVPFCEKTAQIDQDGDRCSIFEHVQEGDWVEKTSLGDKYALFISHFGSFSVSTSCADMANRIYYVKPRGAERKYYSLKDGKAYQCESSCWPGVEKLGTWIEHPQLHSHASIREDTMN